jgi:hypothetical protein
MPSSMQNPNLKRLPRMSRAGLDNGMIVGDLALQRLHVRSQELFSAMSMTSSLVSANTKQTTAMLTTTTVSKGKHTR